MRIETPWFEVDGSAKPLVVTTLHDLGSTTAVAELGAAYAAVLSRGFRQFFITDVGRPARFETTVRHEIAEMVRSLAPLEQQWSLGAAIVVRAPLVRATMTAIRWISRPAVPETYVRNLREAARVAELRVRDAGLELGDDARATLDRMLRGDD